MRLAPGIFSPAQADNKLSFRAPSALSGSKHLLRYVRRRRKLNRPQGRTPMLLYKLVA